MNLYDDVPFDIVVEDRSCLEMFNTAVTFGPDRPLVDDFGNTLSLLKPTSSATLGRVNGQVINDL